MQPTQKTSFQAQIGSELPANLQQIGAVVESAVKSLKRKYDGRKNNGRYKSSVKRGPKPAWLKHLSRNKSAQVIQAYDAIASLAQIYSAAWEKKQLALCVQMHEQARDRAFGKPYVAENPAISKQSAALAQDNRLQVAIQNLVLTPGAKRTASKGKKIKQLAASSPTVDATTADTSTSLDSSTLP